MSSPPESSTLSVATSSTNTSTGDYGDTTNASAPNASMTSTSLDLPAPTAITADLSSSDKANVKFAVLIGLIEVGQVSNKDVVNNVLHLVSRTNSLLIIRSSQVTRRRNRSKSPYHAQKSLSSFSAKARPSIFLIHIIKIPVALLVLLTRMEMSGSICVLIIS